MKILSNRNPAFFVAVALMISGVAYAGPPDMVTIELGGLGGAVSGANGISARGEIAGAGV